MQRNDFLWLASLLAGIFLSAVSVYWFLEPLSLFNTFCVMQPCSIGIIAAALVLMLGLSLLGAGVVLLVRSRQSQTVTIAINDEAEADAEAIGELEEALERGENPEKRLAGKVEVVGRKQVPEKEFAQLPKEELKLRKKKK